MTPEEEARIISRLAELEASMADELREAKHDRREINNKVTCLVKTWDEFQGRHGKLLDLLLAREERKAQVQTALVEKTLAGLIWAFLVGVVLAAWEWLRNHLR